MGFMDLFRVYDINEGVKEYLSVPNAVLLDVRTPNEYFEGRIPKSINIPLQQLGRISDEVSDKNTPLFVYCLSGHRSGNAVEFLKSMGYKAVKNIGGINTYRGEIEQ